MSASRESDIDPGTRSARLARVDGAGMIRAPLSRSPKRPRRRHLYGRWVASHRTPEQSHAWTVAESSRVGSWLLRRGMKRRSRRYGAWVSAENRPTPQRRMSGSLAMIAPYSGGTQFGSLER